MDRNMKSLFEELERQGGLPPIPARTAERLTGVRLSRVRRRVNEALDASPAERRVHRKQRLKKFVLVAAAAACLCTAALAAGSSGLWGHFFTGGTERLEQAAAPARSVSDGDLKVTLEASLMDDNTAIAVVSVEALTEHGMALLWDDEVMRGMDAVISLVPPEDPPVGGSFGYGSGELSDQNTETKRYLSYHTEDAPAGISVCYASETRGRLYIEVPDTPDTETLEVAVGETVVNSAGETCVIESVLLTNFSFRVNQRFEGAEREPFSQFMLDGVYFAMADGSVKTSAQLFDSDTYSGGGGVFKGRLRAVMPLSDFEGVIVSGTEYPFDGSAPRPRAVDPALAPFEFPAVRLDGMVYAPARDLMERLGGGLSWDGTRGCAVLTYRGVTVEVTPDSDVLLRDGRAIREPCAAAMLRDGTLLLDSNVLEDGLDLEIRTYRVDEDGDIVWTVAP